MFFSFSKFFLPKPKTSHLSRSKCVSTKLLLLLVQNKMQFHQRMDLHDRQLQLKAAIQHRSNSPTTSAALPPSSAPAKSNSIVPPLTIISPTTLSVLDHHNDPAEILRNAPDPNLFDNNNNNNNGLPILIGETAIIASKMTTKGATIQYLKQHQQTSAAANQKALLLAAELPKFQASTSGKFVSRAEQIRKFHKMTAASPGISSPFSPSSTKHEMMDSPTPVRGESSLFVTPISPSKHNNHNRNNTPTPATKNNNNNRSLRGASTTPSPSKQQPQQQQDGTVFDRLYHQQVGNISLHTTSVVTNNFNNNTANPKIDPFSVPQFRPVKGNKVTAAPTSSQANWSSLLEPASHFGVVQAIVQTAQRKRIGLLKKAHQELMMFEQHPEEPYRDPQYDKKILSKQQQQQGTNLHVTPSHSQQQLSRQVTTQK
jgi:hypothetical protein